MDTSRGSVNCCEFGLVTHIVNGLGNNFSADGVVAVVVVVFALRQGLKCSRRAPSCFTLIGDKAPPAARDSSEVACA